MVNLVRIIFQPLYHFYITHLAAKNGPRMTLQTLTLKNVHKITKFNNNYNQLYDITMSRQVNLHCVKLLNYAFGSMGKTPE